MRAPVKAKATRIDRVTPPYKSKWEEQYAGVLEQLRAEGQILWYKYEGLRFKLATGAMYSPDFPVVTADGTLEIHEVKGQWREAAKVRWKIVREQFPFVFKLVQKGKGRNAGFIVTEE